MEVTRPLAVGQDLCPKCGNLWQNCPCHLPSNKHDFHEGKCTLCGLAEIRLYDPATSAPDKPGERPTIPMWSHQAEKWVFNGQLYDDPRVADHLFTNALLDYADVLEAKIKTLEVPK